MLKTCQDQMPKIFQTKNVPLLLLVLDFDVDYILANPKILILDSTLFDTVPLPLLSIELKKNTQNLKKYHGQSLHLIF